jgi:hypothetical protein
MVGLVQKALESSLSRLSSLIHVFILSKVWAISLFLVSSNFFIVIIEVSDWSFI